MPNNISFFSIHATDLPAARLFYEQVFGWRFEPWGPPGFYLVHTGDEKNPGLQGLMHKRREPLKGLGMRGFECTIGVDDIDATIQAVEAAGGTLAMQKSRIPTV